MRGGEKATKIEETKKSHMSLPVCSAVGPSESREGLRLGMARGRTSVLGESPRPEEDAAGREDEEAAAFISKGRRGRAKR